MVGFERIPSSPFDLGQTQIKSEYGIVTNPRLLSLATLALFCCTAFLQQPTLAQNPNDFSADNTRQVPENNVAYFDPGQRQATVQLRGFGDSTGQSFANTHVSLIDTSGVQRNFVVNEDGAIVIDNAKAGVYALIASSEFAHGAAILLMKAGKVTEKVAQDLFEIDFLPAPTSESKPAWMTMMATSADQIVPIIQNNLPDSLKTSVKAVDERYAAGAKEIAETMTEVKLGRKGAIRGSLLSVIRPSSIFSAVSGTNVVVFKNGKPVGATKANALGQFQLNGLIPGRHGLMISGRGGYAAISINVIASDLENDDSKSTYSFTDMHFTGDILQVALIPPPMLPNVAKEILAFYPDPKMLEKQRLLEEERLQEERMLANERMLAEQTMLAEKRLLEQERAKRIEIASKTKPKRKPSAASPNEPSHSTLVLDQENTSRSIKSMTAPRVKAKTKTRRNVPVNPLRLKPSTGNVPRNPLRL